MFPCITGLAESLSIRLHIGSASIPWNDVVKRQPIHRSAIGAVISQPQSFVQFCKFEFMNMFFVAQLSLKIMRFGIQSLLPTFSPYFFHNLTLVLTEITRHFHASISAIILARIFTFHRHGYFLPSRLGYSMANLGFTHLCTRCRSMMKSNFRKSHLFLRLNRMMFSLEMLERTQMFSGFHGKMFAVVRIQWSEFGTAHLGLCFFGLFPPMTHG